VESYYFVRQAVALVMERRVREMRLLKPGKDFKEQIPIGISRAIL
jgi:hypothetical protein